MKQRINTINTEHPFFDRLEKLVDDARNYNSKTLARIAEEAGVEYRTLNNLRQKNCFPSCATLEAFSDYFGVSVDYLLGRSEEP